MSVPKKLKLLSAAAAMALVKHAPDRLINQSLAKASRPANFKTKLEMTAGLYNTLIGMGSRGPDAALKPPRGMLLSPATPLAPGSAGVGNIGGRQTLKVDLWSGGGDGVSNMFKALNAHGVEHVDAGSIINPGVRKLMGNLATNGPALRKFKARAPGVTSISGTVRPNWSLTHKPFNIDLQNMSNTTFPKVAACLVLLMSEPNRTVYNRRA